MKSNDKWQYKRLNSSGYEEDDTVGMERDESPLKNIMIAGAVAIGGIAAYKSGLLKKGKKLLLIVFKNTLKFIHRELKTLSVVQTSYFLAEKTEYILSTKKKRASLVNYSCNTW